MLKSDGIQEARRYLETNGSLVQNKLQADGSRSAYPPPAEVPPEQWNTSHWRWYVNTYVRVGNAGARQK